jgi:hypothetical protein
VPTQDGITKDNVTVWADAALRKLAESGPAGVR